MNLLFVLQELPYPASNGHKQKALTILNHLSTRHNCDVLSLGSGSDVDRMRPWIANRPRVRILGVFAPDRVRFLRVRQALALITGNGSRAVLRYRSRQLACALEKAVAERQYSVVHFDLISMAQYCRRTTPQQRVLSLNDSLSLTLFGRARNRFAPVVFRLLSSAHARFQMRIDRKLFRLAQVVHFVGLYDAEWSRTRLGAHNAVHIPLAVDPSVLKVAPSSDSRRNHTLIIVDKLWAEQHRKAVEAFLANHWLRLRSSCPTARLIVIGGKGVPLSFTRFAKGLPGVELYEWVENLEQILSEASIAVFPYAVEVGMKSRVLHCMGAMNAVVGTPDSFRGLAIRNGVEAIVANDHPEMEAAIAHLLINPKGALDIGKRARQFIEGGFTEAIVGDAWEQLYEDVASGAPIRDRYGRTSGLREI